MKHFARMACEHNHIQNTLGLPLGALGAIMQGVRYNANISNMYIHKLYIKTHYH